MSQSWQTKRRERDAALEGAALPGRDASDDAHAPVLADEFAPRRPASGRSLIALALLGLLAAGWIGMTAWTFIDPTIGLRIAPILDIVIRLSAPLVLLVGIGLLALMVLGRLDGEPATEASNADDINAAAAQASESAARIAEVHAQLLGQTKAYAAAADRSASALIEAVGTMSQHGDRLARDTAASVAALEALTARMDAFEAAAPQLDARLAALAETLARLGGELGTHGSALEIQLHETTLAAEAARRELVSASEGLGRRLDGLRDGAKAAGEELAGLSELSSARIDLTLDRVRTVLDTTEQRIEAQNGALGQMVERSRESIDATSRMAVAHFAAHCSEIEATLDRLDERIGEQSDASSAWLEATASATALLGQQFDALEQSTLGRTERLGTAMMALSGETRRLTDALESGDRSSELLIKRAEALLLALDSAIRELDESVPGAVDRVETRLAAMKARVSEARPDIEGLEAIAASVVSRMEDSSDLVASHAAILDQAIGRSQAALAAQKAQVEALASVIVATSDDMTRLGDKVGPHMVDALVRVRETAEAAARRAREAITGVIPEATAQLAEASADAFTQAVSTALTTQMERLGQIAEQLVGTAQGATDSLDRQIRSLSESSDALERRLAGADLQIGTQDRELLTRRSAELIEMLNSRAIDVAKWLGHDISQGEWSAYLKGDQGLFARRAVKMLSRAEMRAIHELYRADADFAEHVNRYVHDFEALLRAVLEAREGSALAVTMLSSDLGKLYVALAQSIERLKGS